jgi:hypothetical protein
MPRTFFGYIWFRINKWVGWGGWDYNYEQTMRSLGASHGLQMIYSGAKGIRGNLDYVYWTKGE